jgi:hypothetical protein
MLQYNGRRVAGFGVGAFDAIGPGIANLQATVAQYSHRITNPSRAVADLQAAGNAAISAVGPALDALSGGNPDVMRLTQLAWRQNGQLAAVNNSGATGSDVDAAREIVNQMIASYQSAKLAAGSVPRSGPVPTPGRSAVTAPPPPAASSTPSADDDDKSSTWTWVAVGAGVLALVVGGAAIAAARSAA